VFLMQEVVIKILLAITVGGAIGIEREYRDKAAGFRTILLICLGANLFTILSLRLGGDEDPVRIAASIVAGVGFLGAGVILRDRGQIMGLTTAATIWIAAALGMGIGGGFYFLSIIASITILIVLLLFPKLEKVVDDMRITRTYELVFPIREGLYEEVSREFEKSRLNLSSFSRDRIEDKMVCKWKTIGKPEYHDELSNILFNHPQILEVHTT
jgi:putative Mg2+ transporter-C (MgtC) family protein